MNTVRAAPVRVMPPAAETDGLKFTLRFDEVAA
jgi:hypothetical protein